MIKGKFPIIFLMIYPTGKLKVIKPGLKILYNLKTRRPQMPCKGSWNCPDTTSFWKFTGEFLKDFLIKVPIMVGATAGN